MIRVYKKRYNQDTDLEEYTLKATLSDRPNESLDSDDALILETVDGRFIEISFSEWGRIFVTDKPADWDIKPPAIQDRIKPLGGH